MITQLPPCLLTTMLGAQAFIENTAVDVMGYQVDVRDIGKAHVLAAEVMLCKAPAGRNSIEPSVLRMA